MEGRAPAESAAEPDPAACGHQRPADDSTTPPHGGVLGAAGGNTGGVSERPEPDDTGADGIRATGAPGAGGPAEARGRLEAAGPTRVAGPQDDATCMAAPTVAPIGPEEVAPISDASRPDTTGASLTAGHGRGAA